jgi:hypothetical protein
MMNQMVIFRFRYVPGHGFALQLNFPNFLHRGV